MVWLKRDAMTVLRARSSREGAIAGANPTTAPELGNSRTDMALASIRKLIEEGHFPAGSRLPAERKLAQQLNMGRPVVREAIKVLNALGMVEAKHGSGTYVKSIQSIDPFAAGAWLPIKSDFSPLDLFEVQKLLEPRAAWLAATRASERHFAEIEQARQRLEMHDRDWKLLARLDMEFHAAIVRGAGNPVLELIQQFLMGRLLALRAPIFPFVQAADRMRDDHRLIGEAILARQADTAEQAMTDHLNAVSHDFITERGGIR